MNPDKNLSVPWELHVFSDVEYEGYNDTWNSFTVYFVIVNGVDITWHLHNHKLSHYWSHKFSIQWSQSYVEKYYYPQSFFMCLLFNNPLPFVLTIWGKCFYWRKMYINRKSTYMYVNISFGTIFII